MYGDLVEIQNAVGTGSIEYVDGARPFEIAMDVFADELPYDTWFNDGPHPGMHVRFSHDENAPLVTFYSSGKYILRAPDLDALERENEHVIEELTAIGLINDEEHTVDLEVSNLVCLAVLERHFNLTALAIGLGLENVEYEPEQFPALIYRNPEYSCTLSVFATGNIVIPGGKDLDVVREDFEAFMHELDELGFLD
jgi:transcription initiation factor TFIID TATA-box-binding protein